MELSSENYGIDLGRRRSFGEEDTTFLLVRRRDISSKKGSWIRQGR
jgi:hypothetical protein